jgi:hypothetical protein
VKESDTGRQLPITQTKRHDGSESVSFSDDREKEHKINQQASSYSNNYNHPQLLPKQRK